MFLKEWEIRKIFSKIKHLSVSGNYTGAEVLLGFLRFVCSIVLGTKYLAIAVGSAWISGMIEKIDCCWGLFWQ